MAHTPQSPAAPSAGHELAIVGDNTYTFTGDADLGGETVEVSRQVHRPVFGDESTWFEVGDLQINPVSLECRCTIVEETLALSRVRLNLVMAAALSATSITYGSLSRDVFGVQTIQEERIPGGYALVFTFAPKTLTWTGGTYA